MSSRKQKHNTHIKFTLSFFFHFLFIFKKFIVEYIFPVTQKRIKYSHSILVIGDAVALGMGDYVTFGSNPGREKQTKKNKIHK